MDIQTNLNVSLNNNDNDSISTLLWIGPRPLQNAQIHISGLEYSTIDNIEFLLSSNKYRIIHWIPECFITKNINFDNKWHYPNIKKNPKLKGLIYFNYSYAVCTETTQQEIDINNMFTFRRHSLQIINYLNYNNYSINAIIVQDPIYFSLTFEVPGRYLANLYKAPLIAEIATNMYAMAKFLPMWEHLFHIPFVPIILLKIRNYYLSYFDFIFTLNKFEKNRLMKEFNNTNMNKKIKIVPSRRINFNLNENHSIAINITNIDSSKYFNLIYIGRLAPEKKLKWFIQNIYEILLTKNKYFRENVKFIVAGRGPESKYIKLLQKKFESNVKYLGQIDNNQVPYLLKKAHLFIMPGADADTYSRCMHEAKYMGIPVVAPINSVASTFITNGTDGFLFNHKSELKNMLMNVITNKNLYNNLKINAKRTAKIFSENNGPKHFEKVIADIVA